GPAGSARCRRSPCSGGATRWPSGRATRPCCATRPRSGLETLSSSGSRAGESALRCASRTEGSATDGRRRAGAELRGVSCRAGRRGREARERRAPARAGAGGLRDGDLTGAPLRQSARCRRAAHPEARGDREGPARARLRSGGERVTSEADLERFLTESCARVDAHLDAFLPAADEPPALLHEAMRYATYSGGKRLRPALVFAAAHAVGLAPERAAPLASAVELVHTYSLVHADLPAMDDDDLRRRRAPAPVQFGEAHAILVADALLAAGSEALAEGGAPLSVVGKLAHCAGSLALVGGQVDDLAFEPERASAEAVRRIHERKTAALFRFSVWAPG